MRGEKVDIYFYAEVRERLRTECNSPEIRKIIVGWRLCAEEKSLARI